MESSQSPGMTSSEPGRTTSVEVIEKRLAELKLSYRQTQEGLLRLEGAILALQEILKPPVVNEAELEGKEKKDG